MSAPHHRIAASPCTACGAMQDAATRTETGVDPPVPGDVAICLRCAHVMIYADDLSRRDPTATEAYEIAGDRRILRAVEAIHRVNQHRKK